MVPWGVVNGNEDLAVHGPDDSQGHLTSPPVKYDPRKPPASASARLASLDPNHSHFILVRAARAAPPSAPARFRRIDPSSALRQASALARMLDL